MTRWGAGRDGVKRDCRHPRVHHEHGTNNAYNFDRCGCEPCVAAHAVAAKRNRRRKGYGLPPAKNELTLAAGSARRVQALMCLGWSAQSLAAVTGKTDDYFWLVGQRPLITVRKAAEISEIYDRLKDGSPPAETKHDQISVGRMKAMAKRRGYLPPSAWDDDNIDDPDAISLETDPLTLTQEQRIRLAEQLVSYGSTLRSAATQARVAEKTIRKYREEVRCAA
jgi:hypothetical protein